MSQRLVDAYLADVAARLAWMPDGQRAETLDGLAEHIAQRLADGDMTGNVLADLGSPETIAAAAGEPSGGPAPVMAVTPRNWPPVVLLIVSILLVPVCFYPFVGIPVGLVLIVTGILLRRSRTWPRPLALGVLVCGIVGLLGTLTTMSFLLAVH